MSMAWMLLFSSVQDKDERPETVVIQIIETTVRDKPSYNGAKICVAKQGEELKFIGWEGAWVKVMVDPNRVGYVNRSTVIDKKKYVPPAAEGSEGSSGGVALATKGFSPQMEKEHKEKNNLQAAYAKLDRMEATPAYLRDSDKLDARLAKFAKEGNLKQ